jgi:hypothetical protein
MTDKDTIKLIVTGLREGVGGVLRHAETLGLSDEDRSEIHAATGLTEQQINDAVRSTRREAEPGASVAEPQAAEIHQRKGKRGTA